MLSLQQSYEVRASIIEYLKAAFSFKEKAVGEAFFRLIEDEENGLFKGPYLSLKLPFEKSDTAGDIPLEIKPPFLPFNHQMEAFRRLSTLEGRAPQPALLTTGTGSGKTESFLYPILDYCHRQEGRPGIKCIILYPMNALAADQANRLAKAIHDDPRLKGKLTAGLFIGLGRDGRKYPKDMAREHIIENRESILDAPPDILLTNFKMLDYALMRHNFHNLWRHNLEDPALLRFLVLDELHTYDGAQGTDVANLIRRLKLKLNLEAGQLCPVGTSATIGSGADAPRLLADYAGKIFGEAFTEEAIIAEERVAREAFFEKDKSDLFNRLPSGYKLQFSRLKAGEGVQSYLERQLDLWQIDPRIERWKLSGELKSIRLVWDIVEACSQKLLAVSELIRELNRANEEFRKLPEWDAEHHFNPKESVISSILALIAEAKTRTPAGDEYLELPFLYLQVQLWVRELSGVLRRFSPEPEFTWRDKQAVTSEGKALPAYFCRECGASGWLAVKHDNRNQFEDEVNDVYSKYFSNHKNIFFVNTATDGHKPVEEYAPTEQLLTFVNQYSLGLHDKEGPGRVHVIALRKVKNNHSQHFCPECNTRNTINIIGMRVSTLASITTSQVLATDLDEQGEKGRKLLAFTNGVQDAAHQAGFIEARNYRFALRTALQKVINRFDEPVALPALQEAFIQYWKENADERGEHPLEAYLYKFFPSDRAGEVRLPAYRQKDGSYRENFVREFDERIRWEIASEFGYNAVIGRTLEKTGSSAVHFDQGKLEQACEALQPWMNDNLMGAFKKEEFLPFLNGLLHRLRIRGGIDHPYLSKFRTRDLKLWDLNWMNDKRHFMNHRFGPKSRLPKLITDLTDTRGILDSTRTQQDNWYHVYLRKSFQLAPYRDVANEFFTELLKVLASPEIGILNEESAGKMRNFCLEPAEIYIHHEVSTLACDTCGHQLTASKAGGAAMEGAKCLQYTCLGTYREIENNQAENYYQQVYNRRRAPRVYAADHTGLLERRDRENKEQDFKQRPRSNSLNVLVATSTLEMGIDIGDLNVAMNNSVPPLTANFLQRVGRAGRKSGSAVIFNFAANKPHDLYYYEEPLDMMDGEINTPGCYLDARDILRRHFFAYCIDSWTLQDPQGNAIPQFVRNLKPATANLDDPQFFLNRLISYIKTNEQSLLTRLHSMYEGEVGSPVFQYLRELLQNEQFYQFPQRIFRELKLEYNQLREKRREIREYIREKGLDKNDEDRKELEKEGRNLLGTMKSIEKRQVLEHMTNVGLLPNYAFPETGVTLNARVRGRALEGSDGPPPTKDIELVRPASQAIKELIPDNLFYTQGYKLKIIGLNVLNWKEEAQLFRYCAQCDHIEEEVRAGKGPCPKCGHESFGSVANRHQFLRLQGVRSFNEEADAKLDDSSEERQSEFGIRSRHFRFSPKASLGAYAFRKVPFGIEYVREVDIFDVNAGIASDFMDKNRITTINKREVALAGYITCRSCGRSSSQIYKQKNGRWEQKEARDYHFAYCKEREKAYQGKPDEVFEELFLYREMKTEALKILLPVQEFESESAVSMFKAGIELGLRKYYKGNPQHLVLSHYAEYNFQTLKMDRYLVLFDVIPGGTGYLEKLFNPDEFKAVLKLAYEAIRGCQCQHQGKDGCYRCIYSYSNQFEQEELSRKKAEQLFQKILRAAENMESLPHGLGNVTNTGQIEESELEERFVRALRNLAEREEEWTFEEINRNGLIGYQLKMVRNGNEFHYFLQPQYRLGPVQGVRFVTIADFLIRCERALVGGREIPPEELEGMPAVAIYLDGFQYHASREHPRFPLDVDKRVAINQAPGLMSWALTWDDINHFEEKVPDQLGKVLMKNTQTRKTARKLPALKGLEGNWFEAKNNFSRLLWLLENGHLSRASWKNHFHSYLLSLQETFGAVSLSEEHLQDHLRTGTPLEQYPQHRDAKGNNFLFVPIPAESDQFSFRLFVKMSDLAVGGGVLIRHQGEGFSKADWDTFWKVFNLVQLDTFKVKMEEGVPEEDTPLLPDQPETAERPLDLEEILQYYDEEYHQVVEVLINHHIDFSMDGSYVLTDENKVVLAEAILGFDRAKIALGPLSEEDAKTLKAHNYTILEPKAFDINQIMDYEADHLR